MARPRRELSADDESELRPGMEDEEDDELGGGTSRSRSEWYRTTKADLRAERKALRKDAAESSDDDDDDDDDDAGEGGTRSSAAEARSPEPKGSGVEGGLVGTRRACSGRWRGARDRAVSRAASGGVAGAGAAEQAAKRARQAAETTAKVRGVAGGHGGEGRGDVAA